MEEALVRKFAEDLTRLQRQLYLYIVALVPRAVDAEDILQETNRIVWEKMSEFTPGSDFAAWAYRIAFFEVMAWRRLQRNQAPALSDEVLETLAAELPKSCGLDGERRAALECCLSELKQPDRELISKRYVDGSSIASISAEADRSDKSVYRSLDRIRGMLLGCIQRRLAAGSQI